MLWLKLLLAFVAVSGLIFSVLGAWIAKQNGRRKSEGAILGFFFGPIGVLVEALLPTWSGERPGPYDRLTDDELVERFPAIAARMGRRSHN